MSPIAELGVGIGWRPEIDLTVEHLPGVDFVEVVAESVTVTALPESIDVLRRRGLPVLPHAVTLSLGGAEPLDVERVARLGRLAQALKAPMVSDHACFVRAGGLDAGHLLPLPRTREALDVLVANVRQAQDLLPVPLALENVAAVLDWPDSELTEEAFLAELVARTDCWLIVDVANLYANAHNLGTDPARFLDTVPLERVAYVHVAGGAEVGPYYYDTHAHPVRPEVLALLDELCARYAPPGALLEWDDDYPSDAALAAELDAIATVLRRPR